MADVQRISVLTPACLNAITPISIAPLEPSARYSLRLRASIAAELRQPCTFRLASPINTCRVQNGRTLARLGPDEWLILGSVPEGDSIARELEHAMANQFFSLVDISHRNTGIAIAGIHAREVINSACPLDLDDGVFPPGSATRTLLGKAEIILFREGVEPIYRVECWRSFAPYVYGFLRTAAREFEFS